MVREKIPAIAPAMALRKAFREALVGVESFDEEGTDMLVAITVPKVGITRGDPFDDCSDEVILTEAERNE